MIENWKVVDLFVCSRKLCLKISKKELIRNLQEKQKSAMITNKHNKNNIFVVDQCTIAANEPKQVYLAIK